MLVLSRKLDESIIITVPPSDSVQQIRVTILEARGDKTRMGFRAERDIVIHREEIQRVVDKCLAE